MIVVDTNIFFSAYYSPRGKEAAIVRMANAGRVILLSPGVVREELERVLRRRLGLGDEEVDSFITSPVIWIPRAEYAGDLDRARSMLEHEEDSPILACALRLDAHC